MSRPMEADMFLLEPQPNLNSIVAQIVVESSLLGSQPVQVQPWADRLLCHQSKTALYRGAV
jgi:hypothetical protein